MEVRYGSESPGTAEKEGDRGAEQGTVNGIAGYPSIYESAL